jgi:hypothetical protein
LAGDPKLGEKSFGTAGSVARHWSMTRSIQSTTAAYLGQVPAEPLDLGGDLVAVAGFEDAAGKPIGDGQPHRYPLDIGLTDVHHARPPFWLRVG